MSHDTPNKRFDFLGIVTIFAQHLSVGARQLSLHYLGNRSCLGYQGLRGVVKETSPGKPEEGNGKEECRVSDSSEMFSTSGVDKLGKTLERQKGDIVWCSL